MQKVINGISLFSGVVSLTVVVGGVWVYLEKDNLVNGVKTQMINGVTESIQQMFSWYIRCINARDSRSSH